MISAATRTACHVARWRWPRPGPGSWCWRIARPAAARPACAPARPVRWGPNRCRRSATSSAVRPAAGSMASASATASASIAQGRSTRGPGDASGWAPVRALTFSSLKRSAITNCAFSLAGAVVEVTLMRCLDAVAKGTSSWSSGTRVGLVDRAQPALGPALHDLVADDQHRHTGPGGQPGRHAASRTLDIPAPLAPTTSKP